MKTSIKPAVLLILGVFLMFGPAWAQEQQFPCQAIGPRVGMMAIYTDQQKEMLKQIMEKKKSFKTVFQQTVSKEQSDILEDPRLMPAERKKAYRASFTDKQVNLIKAHNAEIKKMREELRTSLTPEQLAAFQKGKKPQGNFDRGPGQGRGKYCPCCPCAAARN